MVAIGAHVDSSDPLTAAAAVGAGAAQFFLADPQGWKKPVEHPHAAALRAADIPLYIHAPYIINVATMNNRIRIPSRKILSQHAAAAADIGARGLIVHGGHVASDSELDKGFENWHKVFEREEFPVPILIENTAGGNHAIARRFDRLARLWDAVGEYGVGFCLDTCHAFAGGEELGAVVDRVMAITGRIDLVHANSSRDGFDSGADRHANFDDGTIEAEQIAAVCTAAGSDVIVETPGDGQSADITFLRKFLD
ncbi:deoxyribonuclease-4 [Nakamurella sp. UYEF19]|uniref:deoxyribonuclease IV n=1 Tax=Nakamurella sp. UYEF19 TaxID=1756392 RepID=UPI0033929278